MSKLDLHGVKHVDVRPLLDSFLWENMQKNKKEVTIITGFSEQMKRIVNDLVGEYNMNSYEDPRNGGVIMVEIK